MAERYQLHDIQKVQKRLVFFDANILIYVFWPTGLSQWVNNYSSAFGKLCKQKNQMFIDFTVISEVVNRTVRIDYGNFLLKNNVNSNTYPFKKFRNSANGQQALEDIYLIVRDEILPRFDIYGEAFTKSDIETFLHVDSLDFTDKAIVKLCKAEHFVLITNDKDFLSADIDVLTSNPIYFKK